MTNSATADVKRLVQLAERMGLPAREAIQQVQDLAPDAEPAPERPTDATTIRRPPA